MTTTTSLDDLRTQLAAMLAEGRGDDVLDIVISLLASMRDKNTALAMDVARLPRQRVGRTSEKVDAAQLSLLLGMLQADPAADGAAPEPPAATTLPRPKTKPAKEGHGRRPLPPHLERQEIVHEMPASELACPICGAERTCIGHERSEVLEFVPATFRVEVHIREKLACRACESAVATAPAADKVIERGLPGPGLLAHVVVSKYQDDTPLHRLRRIYLREKVDLAVSTLAGWVEAGHDALHPLAERIRALARTAYLVQADDTGLKVLDKDSPGGSKRGHLWCYVGDEKLVAIVYTPTWRKEGPQGFLAGRKGYVQADAYKGYDGLSARCAGSPWAEKTTCSRAATAAPSVPPRCTRSSARARSPASSPLPTSATCSSSYRAAGRRHASTSCCQSTGPPTAPRTPSRPPPRRRPPRADASVAIHRPASTGTGHAGVPGRTVTQPLLGAGQLRLLAERVLGFSAARETFRKILIRRRDLVVALQQERRRRPRRIRVSGPRQLWGWRALQVQGGPDH